MKPDDKNSRENSKTPKSTGIIPDDSLSAEIRSIHSKQQLEDGDRQAAQMIEAMDALIDHIEEKEAKGDQRKIRANHRSVTGWLANMPGEETIPFESTLERDCAYLASFDERVFSIRAQPHTIIYRTASGRMSRYTPDYEIEYEKNGNKHKVLVEVKEIKTLKEDMPLLRPKFSAARDYCKEHGGRFVVLTENQLRAPLIKNVRFLYGIRMKRQTDVIARLGLLKQLRSLLPMSMDEILNLNGPDKFERASIQTLLWGLIAENSVYIDLSEPILLNSMVLQQDAGQQAPLFFEESEPW